jgi:predicted SnoaL-like aldol condensation-catalyzing enzyme
VSEDPTTQNKRLVLQAFDTLFNKRDYVAAEQFWSVDYLQHSAYIPPGREGLFSLIRSLPASLRHEAGIIVAEGEFVVLQGRFSGHGLPRNWVVADILRVQNGLLIEHWDVIQDEATAQESKSGQPMFGLDFFRGKDTP